MTTHKLTAEQLLDAADTLITEMEEATTPADAQPTMTMAEVSAALRDRDSAQHLTDDECRYALIWLLGYTRSYGKRGDWTNQAIAQAVKSRLDARTGGAK